MSYDAPPLDDDHAPPDFWVDENGRALILLANAIDRLTEAVGRLSASPPAPSAPAPPSAPPSAPPKGEKTTQQKRGGLIFITCRNNNVTVVQAAESAGRGRLADDARTWSDADQLAVIEAMKGWGWIEDKR